MDVVLGGPFNDSRKITEEEICYVGVKRII